MEWFFNLWWALVEFILNGLFGKDAAVNLFTDFINDILHAIVDLIGEA